MNSSLTRGVSDVSRAKSFYTPVFGRYKKIIVILPNFFNQLSECEARRCLSRRRLAQFSNYIVFYSRNNVYKTWLCFTFVRFVRFILCGTDDRKYDGEEGTKIRLHEQQ